MILRYRVPAGPDRKIYTVLRRELGLSAALVRRMKVTGGITLDGTEAFTTALARPGQEIAADVTLAEPPCDLVPQPGPVEVLFENEGLLALNKPAGLLVHPSQSRYVGTLANFAAGYLERTAGDPRCHAVNRLDRDTSGVVLFAKNAYMKERAAAALAAPETEKRYLALVWGTPPCPAGTVALPILREDPRDLRRCCDPAGQRAVTDFRLLESRDGVSVLSLVLHTGRTHQIRVHCRELGMPLLGDGLYGTEDSRRASERLQITGQALHACLLRFPEPLSRKLLTIRAPLRRGDLGGGLKFLEKWA